MRPLQGLPRCSKAAHKEPLSGSTFRCSTEAEVQELEQDTYEGKRPPLEHAAPAPLHTEPGVYVPQVGDLGTRMNALQSVCLAG